LPFFTEIDTFEIRKTANGSGPSAPTDGIYLARLQFTFPTGPSIDFNPPPPLAPRITTLPVQAVAAAPSSPTTTVDPVHGLVLTLTGTFDGTKPVRLDACGEVLLAWQFTGQRALRSISDQSVSVVSDTYNLFLAPQYGGLLVGDHVRTTTTVESLLFSVDLDSTIGGLTPKAAA
jgi:hypothetical protein